jgi:hypothetical protein
MLDIGKKINDYSEELFADLGMSILPEEKKADIYARVQEHIHEVILDCLSEALDTAELYRIKQAMDVENYVLLKKALDRHPDIKDSLEEKIDAEFNKLKLTVAEEQKN